MAKLLNAWGGKLCSVLLVAPGFADDNNRAFFDSAYSDSALSIGNNAVAYVPAYDPASAPALVPYATPAGHSFYFHAQYGFSDNSARGGVTVVQLVDSAGYPWLRITTDMDMDFNSGTGVAPAWTTLGNTMRGPGQDSHVPFDIKVDLDAGGNHHATFFMNDVAVIGPAAFTQAALTNMAGARLTNDDDYAPAPHWSQGLITEDLSTIGSHVATTRGTGAGAHTAWTGTVAGVNAPVNSDASPNQATAAGLLQSYPQTNITVPEGYLIAGVFAYLRAKNDGAGPPQNLTALCRPASTDHATADLGGMGVGYGSVGARYDANPDTSAAWTAGEWNTPAELGFGSAA